MSDHVKKLLIPHSFRKLGAVSAKERHLFYVRMVILTSFGLCAVAALVWLEETRFTFGLVIGKFLDSAGEALSEALATGVEDEFPN